MANSDGMNRGFHWAFGLVVGATISLSAFGGPNLVANPGFEDSCAFSSDINIGPPQWHFQPAPYFPLLVGWDTRPHSGACAAAFGAYGLPPEGGIDDTISQLIPTTPGVKYTVSFWADLDYSLPGFTLSRPAPYHLAAWFADNAILDADFAYGSTESILTTSFAQFSHTIEATSTTSWLSISARSYSVQWVIVDDVSVVPEPATLALLGVGLAGLAFSRRKL